MGNFISKISKDHFTVFEEEAKNKTFFQKGRVRSGIDMVTGGTYIKLYYIKKYSNTLAPLQTWMWWRNLF